MPSSLAGTVEAVVGLDQSAALVHTDHVIADATPSGGFRNAPPCSTYWGEKPATTLPQFEGQTLPYAPCGYVPVQLRGAYGLTGAGDGSGQTVAIIDAYASPTILQDANEYSKRHGLPTFSGNQFSQVVAPGTMRRPENPRQDPQGWYGEETLDVEAVHSMAPGANIVNVGAPNNYQDLDAALNHVVNNRLAQIVTNSYGWAGETLPPGFVKPYNDVLIQAAAEGIGVYFSSGDSGDESLFLSRPQPDFPASSPWVTAVGGTSLGVGADNQRLFELGHRQVRPVRQEVEPPVLAVRRRRGHQQRLRRAGVPVGRRLRRPDGADVSMVGDPNTGMLVGQTQTFPDGTYYDEFRLGGTSLSSPLLAGLMAVADQAAGQPAGDVRVDYVNGVDDTDGTVTSLRAFGDTLTLHSVPGYDDANGWGTPNASFISAISNY